MTEDTGIIRVRLTKDFYGFSGLPFPKGTVLEARIGTHGKLEVEVVGSRYLSLRPDQWEPAWSDEDLQRCLDKK